MVAKTTFHAKGNNIKSICDAEGCGCHRKGRVYK